MTNKKQTKSTKKSKKAPTTRTGYFKEKLFESDSTYLLKLVIIIIFGAIWVKLSTPVVWLGLPIGAFPVGLVLGLLLVKLMESHQSDRKIWYVVLIVVAIVTYSADRGIVI